MYVDWEYYKIFYYVAKYQNFTKAARVLGNNQPNITHAMNRLESQLNCVLFIRSNRGVTLTPEGAMLYSRIASAAVQIQDAEEELSASATLEHGAISISATETALNIYLSEKLRAFHTEYPGIRLRISNHSTPQAVQAVKNGEVDFAIVSTPAEVEPGLKMVELKPFYEVLVGGRTFTALSSQNLSLKELNNYPLISLSDESMTRAFYRQFFLDHGAVLKPDTEAATTDQMLTLVKSELGLAFLPQPMAGEPLARGEIVDDDAMMAALDTGWVSTYITDFPNNRIVKAPHVIAMPHLGASTPESEQNCAAMAVDELTDYLENGNISSEFVETDAYSYDETEGVYYMDTSVLKAGDVLYKTDSQDTYTVSKRATLIGVYNVNKGYADFKQINILYQNDEYSIVRANTTYGLNVYDYIVLDGSAVSDDQIITNIKKTGTNKDTTVSGDDMAPENSPVPEG